MSRRAWKSFTPRPERPQGPRPITVTLSWREIFRASKIGCYIECLDRSQGMKDNQGYDRSYWDDAIVGQIAELAVSKHLGLPYTGKIGNFRREPDVGGFEVRATRRKQGRLIVTPLDSQDRRYLLCIVEEPRVEIVGWLYGSEAAQVGSFETHRAGGGAWYIARDRLTSFGAVFA